VSKTYKYEVFSGTVYKGTLENVISEFEYNQTINTIGTQTTIAIQSSIDDIGLDIDTDVLVDENGNNIIDEVSNRIATRYDYEFANIPLDLGNVINIYEYSVDYPSGIKVFEGVITKWSTNLLDNVTYINVFSRGYELDQYVISESGTVNLEQLSYNNSVFLLPSSGKVPVGQAVAQVFNVAVETDIRAINVMMSADDITLGVGTRLELISGTPDNPQETIATVDKNTLGSTTPALESYDFGSTVTLSAGNYYFVIQDIGYVNSFWSHPYVYYSDSDPYASGDRWYSTSYPTTALTEQTGSDIAFTVTSSTGSAVYTFINIDSGIGVRNAMDIYSDQGGNITYTTDTVETSSQNMYYNFNVSSVKEIIDKCLSVAPADYYYYVDPASSTLYFKSRAITSEHNFRIGYDLAALNLERNIEEMVNTVYFTGGDTGSGDNLLLLTENTSSVNKYGRWTDIVADNRVTVQATGEKYSQATLDANSEPKFRMQAEVLADKYDVNTINVGDMVRILNSGNIIDDLLLQVVEKIITPYKAILTLGSIQPRASTTVEKLSQQLELQEKENNPDTIT